MAVEDEDGYVPVQRRRPRPIPLTLGDLPVRTTGSQKYRRGFRNRFSPLRELMSGKCGSQCGCMPTIDEEDEDSSQDDDVSTGLTDSSRGGRGRTGDREQKECEDDRIMDEAIRQNQDCKAEGAPQKRAGTNEGTPEAADLHRLNISNEPDTSASAQRHSHTLLMYSEEGDEGRDEPAMTVQWSDIDIDVVLDSGCSDHVMNVEIDAPGYVTTPSDGSRSGRGFIVGNGERIPNEGQATINLRARGEKGQPMDFQSTFQSAKVTRPLMSVAKICQNGYGCIFSATEAIVQDKQGQTMCRFRREGGIYVGRLKLRAPAPFGRPA